MPIYQVKETRRETPEKKESRKGLGIELNHAYHEDAVYWLKKAERDNLTPSLFDLLKEDDINEHLPVIVN